MSVWTLLTVSWHQDNLVRKTDFPWRTFIIQRPARGVKAGPHRPRSWQLREMSEKQTQRRLLTCHPRASPPTQLTQSSWILVPCHWLLWRVKKLMILTTPVHIENLRSLLKRNYDQRSEAFIQYCIVLHHQSHRLLLKLSIEFGNTYLCREKNKNKIALKFESFYPNYILA